MGFVREVRTEFLKNQRGSPRSLLQTSPSCVSLSLISEMLALIVDGGLDVEYHRRKVGNFSRNVRFYTKAHQNSTN